MKGVLIKISKGHKLRGEGECLGKDKNGDVHTFWRMSPEMEVPLDLALKLENEVPKRFEMVDRELARELLCLKPVSEEKPLLKEGKEGEVEEKEVVVEEKINPKLSKKELSKMTKDDMNDWAAKNGYEVDPGKQLKKEMINSLLKQMKK